MENLIGRGGGESFRNKAQALAGLKVFKETFCPEKCNADIQHRWCELIVLHNITEEFQFLEEFLAEHQAMGIYLYGEMKLSKNKALKRLAKKIMLDLSPEMDSGTLENVKAIMA